MTTPEDADVVLDELREKYKKCSENQFGYKYTLGGVLVAIPLCAVMS
jgi:hypothetical protein